LIKITTQKENKLNLKEVSYIFNYAFNLISLFKLKKIDIIYHDRDEYMIFKKNNLKIARVKRFRHLYVLKIKINDKIMIIDREKFIFMKKNNEHFQL